MWPTDDTLLAAWRRLLADPTANGAFAELVVGPLHADLTRQRPWADPHLVTEAVDWAVLALLRNPSAYDPAKLPLARYLGLAARRDLANLLQKDGRHHRGRIPWADVELVHPARNEEEDGDTLADHPGLLAAVEGLGEADRRVFDLMCDGERDTAVFAAALGIADVPADEQAAEVKRAKDRVKQRLKRAGRGP